MDTVIPAYERMMEGLEKLKGTGVNPGGLSHLEKGKGYYEYLARSLTGVDAAPDELAAGSMNGLANCFHGCSCCWVRMKRRNV